MIGPPIFVGAYSKEIGYKSQDVIAASGVVGSELVASGTA
jgi:hypothetical protein